VFKGNVPEPASLTVAGGEVRLRRHASRAGKIGSDSPQGWARAVVGRTQFTIRAAVDARTQYPDDGCSQEVWSNPDPYPYMELEILGPVTFLQPGDRCTLTTRWQLERLPSLHRPPR
jgi:hypothetical protein